MNYVMNKLVKWVCIHLSEEFDVSKADCSSQGCAGCLLPKVPVGFSMCKASSAAAHSLLETPADTCVFSLILDTGYVYLSGRGPCGYCFSPDLVIT